MKIVIRHTPVPKDGEEAFLVELTIDDSDQNRPGSAENIRLALQHMEAAQIQYFQHIKGGI